MALDQPFVLTGLTLGAMCIALGAWIQRRITTGRAAREAEEAARRAASAARCHSDDMLAPLRARRAARVTSHQRIRKAADPSHATGRDRHA